MLDWVLPKAEDISLTLTSSSHTIHKIPNLIGFDRSLKILAKSLHFLLRFLSSTQNSFSIFLILCDIAHRDYVYILNIEYSKIVVKGKNKKIKNVLKPRYNFIGNNCLYRIRIFSSLSLLLKVQKKFPRFPRQKIYYSLNNFSINR